MTAKEYLSQARVIDRRIQAKTEQLEILRDIADRITPFYSDMPKSQSYRNTREDAIIAMIDLKEELRADISSLLREKTKIMTAIKKVPDKNQQMVLELRYLCNKPFNAIASELEYGIDNVYRIHREGLKNIVVPDTIQ